MVAIVAIVGLVVMVQNKATSLSTETDVLTLGEEESTIGGEAIKIGACEPKFTCADEFTINYVDLDCGLNSYTCDFGCDLETSQCRQPELEG